MSQAVNEGQAYKRITATDATIKTGQGQTGHLFGILCSSTTAGTFAVTDSNGTITGTVTPAAGQFVPIPCEFQGTLTVTVGGTLDATIFYNVG